MDLSVSENREQRCSFCGRKKSEVKRMIASPNEAAICDVCIEICNAILEDQNIEENTENIVLPTPSEIKEQLQIRGRAGQRQKNAVCCGLQSL